MHNWRMRLQLVRIYAVDVLVNARRHWRIPTAMLFATFIGLTYVGEHIYCLDLSTRVFHAQEELNNLNKQNKQLQSENLALDNRDRVDQIAIARCNFQVLPLDRIVDLTVPALPQPQQAVPTWSERVMTQVTERVARNTN